jgi:hypothetical protein
MATPEEVARTRTMLGGFGPAPMPVMPAPVPASPTVADEMARASLPQRAPTFQAMPSGPMSPDQAAAAGMLGINAPPAATLPPTADQIARAPAYTPDMGPITGVVGAAPPPQTTAAGQAIAQARDALLARSKPKGPVDLAPRGAMAPNERSEGKPPVPGSASVAAARQALVARGGGGGGVSPINKLQSAVKADEARILGTFDTEKKAMGDASRAEQMQTDDAAQRMGGMANDVEARAAEEAGYQRDYEEQRNTFRAQTQALTEEIRSAKVDPSRLYGEPKFGSAIAIAIGGAVAGMFQGLRGGENQFVNAINRNIDLDINAQQSAIDNKKSALSARNTLYGQLVSSHQDSALARLQTKNAMLESAKMQMEAEAKRLGNPVAAANAERGINAIDRQQASVQLDIDKAERDAAIRAQAAAAAARAAAEERNFKRGVELEKLRIENRKVDVDEAKETGGAKLGERFVATGQDPTTGAATGYLARNGKVAEERTNGLAASKKAVQLIDQILALREEQGKLGRFTSRGDGSFLGTPKWKTEAKGAAAELQLQLKEINKLGAVSEGFDATTLERLAPGNVTALDALGDETNDKLRAARARILSNAQNEGAQEAGTQVAKQVGPDGREVYVPLGRVQAPTNARAVPRTPVGR